MSALYDFIELTNTNGSKVRVNISKIAYLMAGPQSTTVWMSGVETPLSVIDGIDTLVKKIADAQMPFG